MSIRRKILFMSATSELGGAEKVLLSCAKYLDQNKYETILLAQSQGSLTEEFSRIGKEVVLFPLPAWRKAKNIFSRYYAVIRLLKLIREKNIDILHCNAFRLTPYLIYCCRILKIPGFVHLHDRLTVRQRKSFFLEKAGTILAVSDYVRQPFQSLSVRTEKIYNGIVAQDYANKDTSFKAEFNIPSGVLVIGMIANFTQNKRPEKFLEVAACVKKIYPQVRFVIVGSNTWNSAITIKTLQIKACELGISEELILTGWRNDVGKILPAFDALVIPSVSEAFSLVVLEAMAARVVVFANETAGGPAELIQDKFNGFLVDFDNPENVARMIINVFLDDKRKVQIIENAFQRVMANFDMTIFVRNIRDFYNSFFPATEKEAL